MAFEGRSIRDASRACQEHRNRLLAHTITQMPIIAIVDERYGRVDLSFRRGGLMGSAPLQTRFGPVELIFGETYDRVDGQSARVALRMIAYQYAVKLIGTDEPLLRWEFVQFPGGRSYWCCNHLQGPVTVSVGGRAISLNDWHLPTGPVPIEEIVRFCLVDLGVPPLDTNVDADGTPGWHLRLHESVAVTVEP